MDTLKTVIVLLQASVANSEDKETAIRLAQLGRLELNRSLGINRKPIMKTYSTKWGAVITPSRKVRKLILDGGKIAGVKEYRDVTGYGLLQAKEVIEELCVKEIQERERSQRPLNG